MKTKYFKSLLLSALTICLVAFGLASASLIAIADETEPTEHEHVFDQQIMSLDTNAGGNCDDGYNFYYSCECGEIDPSDNPQTFQGQHIPENTYTASGTGTHYVECIQCKAIIEGTEEDCYGGTATCTTKATCEVCEHQYGEKLPHTKSDTYYQNKKDDGTSAHWITCSECNSIIDETEEECHGGSATCALPATCAVCGCFYGDYADHDEANISYEQGNSYGKPVHYLCCSLCNEMIGDPEDCYGGTATCTTYAECEVCGQEHGEKDLTNHSTDEVSYDYNSDGTHDVTCADCNTVLRTEDCSGGEANCVNQAICEYCTKYYGELDLDNHSSDEVVYYPNGDAATHKVYHTCCATTDEENIPCSGGMATCSIPAICQYCNYPYSDLDLGNHVSEPGYYYDESKIGEHVVYYTCCEEEYLEPCSGGTATCSTYAECYYCGHNYGNLDYTKHESDETRIVANYDGTHSTMHVCCGTRSETVECTFSEGETVCSVCGGANFSTAIEAASQAIDAALAQKLENIKSNYYLSMVPAETIEETYDSALMIYEYILMAGISSEAAIYDAANKTIATLDLMEKYIITSNKLMAMCMPANDDTISFVYGMDEMFVGYEYLYILFMADPEVEGDLENRVFVLNKVLDYYERVAEMAITLDMTTNVVSYYDEYYGEEIDIDFNQEYKALMFDYDMEMASYFAQSMLESIDTYAEASNIITWVDAYLELCEMTLEAAKTTTAIEALDMNYEMFETILEVLDYTDPEDFETVREFAMENYGAFLKELQKSYEILNDTTLNVFDRTTIYQLYSMTAQYRYYCLMFEPELQETATSYLNTISTYVWDLEAAIVEINASDLTDAEKQAQKEALLLNVSAPVNTLVTVLEERASEKDNSTLSEEELEKALDVCSYGLHRYTVLTKDETGHTYSCERCGEAKATQPHDGNICGVCGHEKEIVAIGVSKAEIDENGHLIITLDDGTEIDAGSALKVQEIVAKEGCNGSTSSYVAILALLVCGMIIILKRRNA